MRSPNLGKDSPGRGHSKYKGPEASFEEELGVLGQAQGLERRELKEEDSGPEGGVVTWLGDFVGQS